MWMEQLVWGMERDGVEMGAGSLKGPAQVKGEMGPQIGGGAVLQPKGAQAGEDGNLQRMRRAKRMGR